MSRPGEDDRDAVDRAFADLVAGFHLTAERPGPVADPPRGGEPPAEAVGEAASPSYESVSTNEAVTDQSDPSTINNDRGAGDGVWPDQRPLFRFTDPTPAAEVRQPSERFVPEPPLPLARPPWPVLTAWLAMGYAVLAVLATALGLHLPVWAGWLALVGFVGGFGVLVARLPRHRPPDAGDGAVL